MSQAERIVVGEKTTRFVCAQCRRALLEGHSPCFPIPQPGNVMPDPWKQSLCGPCYKVQYRLAYPDAPEPIIVDGYDLDYPDPFPHEASQEEQVAIVTQNLDVWERAIIRARESRGSESVIDAYNLIISKPDLEVSSPPEPYLSDP